MTECNNHIICKNKTVLNQEYFYWCEDCSKMALILN